MISDALGWEWLTVALPFSTLQITNGVRKDETVPRTHRLNNAGSNVIFPTARVRLIHSVEFATTTHDLGMALEHIP